MSIALGVKDESPELMLSEGGEFILVPVVELALFLIMVIGGVIVLAPSFLLQALKERGILKHKWQNQT